MSQRMELSQNQGEAPHHRLRIWSLADMAVLFERRLDRQVPNDDSILHGYIPLCLPLPMILDEP